MRAGRLASTVAAGVLAASALVAARQQAPATFKAGVDLVTVDVRVLDKAGRPVPGLTAEDFTVSLDGKPSEVRLIDYLTFPTRTPSSVTAAGLTQQQSGIPTGRTGRSIIFGIDDRSIRVEDMPPYSQAITRAIGLLGDDDLAGLVMLNGQNVAATKDRTALVRAVRGLTGHRVLPFVPVFVGVEESRMYHVTRNESLFSSIVERECGGTAAAEREACANMVRGELFADGASLDRDLSLQVDALFNMIEAARALPPPRIVILCSNGFATWTDKLNDFKPIAEMALRADVQIEYLTQLPPNLDSSAQPRTQFARSATAPSLVFLRDEDEKFLRRGGDNVAELLGAPIHRFMIGSDPALENVIIGWSASYRLGLQPPDNAGLSRLVPLKVTVRTPGAKAYANRQALLTTGALAAADGRGLSASPGAPMVPAPPTTPEGRLAAAIDAGGASAVPITIGAAARRDEIGREVQVITVQVPRNVPGPVTAQFAVFDDAGRVVHRGAPELVAGTDGPYRAVFSVTLGAGRYRLRAAGLDAAGAIGVGELVVDTKPVIVGALAVSDILFIWKDDEGKPQMMSTELMPASADAVQASLEFYPATPGGKVVAPVVTMAILRADSTPVVEWTPPVQLSMRGAQTAVLLPWDSLEPGRYTVRATITSGTAPPLTLTRAITKTP